MLDRLGATELRGCKVQSRSLKSAKQILGQQKQPLPQVTGGGNLKLLFPRITVYFVDRSDFIDANPGSFDARGSDGSGVDLGKSRFISYLGA